MRRAANVDANQARIVAALRKAGATVQLLHGVGAGCPDLAVGYRGQNFFVEVKDGDKIPSKRKLNAVQEQWHSSWRGQCCTVKTEEEALAAVGIKTGLKQEQSLPGDSAQCNMSGLAGATNATSSPNATPYSPRRDTLNLHTIPEGKWQALGDLAQKLAEELAQRRAAQAAAKKQKVKADE